MMLTYRKTQFALILFVHNTDLKPLLDLFFSKNMLSKFYNDKAYTIKQLWYQFELSVFIKKVTIQ